MKGYLRKIIPFSTVDGPGNRTGIFLQGCNFNCLYCHNPETIEIATEKNQIDDVKYVDYLEIIEEAMKYANFTSGVTISGGECTVQFEFLYEMCKEFTKRGVSVYIDTNGYLAEEKMDLLAEVIDQFMFDIKAIDDDEHIMLTGKSNKTVLKNLKKQMNNYKVFEVRTVIIPDLINNENNVREVSKILSKSDKIIRYKIIKYRNIGVVSKLSKHPSPKKKLMDDLEKIAKENGVKDIIII